MRKSTTAPVALVEYYELYQLALSYEGKSAKTIVVYFSNLNRFLRYLQGSPRAHSSSPSFARGR